MEEKRKKYTVTFLPHEREIDVDEDENLIRAALNAGVHINASCGGEGICGKRRVLFEQGVIEGGISEKLSTEDIDKGYRLACLSQVKSDLMVRVPIESELDAGVLNMQSAPRQTTFVEQSNFTDIKTKGLHVPPIEKIYCELPKPSKDDNTSDLTRLITYLSKECDEHRLQPTLSVVQRLPDIIRECDYNVTVTLERPVRGLGKNRIVNIQACDMSQQNCAIAIDIGTTTIYGQLINLLNGEILAEHADFNSQISYGEDVISRIVASEKPAGLEKLNSTVVKTINGIISKITKKAGIEKCEITSITLAGNTTMTQIFLNVNPKWLRRAPYVPAANFYPPISAKALGLDLSENAVALIYPNVSSYVGGDIVAGIMGSGLYRSEELVLFIDIGTNAEIVIGNRDWLACAACSAGPAFEGGGIQFGMRAAEGAIEDFSIDPVTLEPMTITIGKVRARGICGSGLISIVATMLEMGIIDNSGKYNQKLNTNRIRKTNDVYEYVLVEQEHTQIDRDIVLTEIDIGNLIRAKGAIFAGYQTLLKEVGLSIHDIDRIYLAGGFGSYIDLEKAIGIGLFPEIDKTRVTYIGNASLMGAKMSCLTNKIRQDVRDVLSRVTNFELSETASYMDSYTASLFLPHTDMTYFPELEARLRKRNAGK